MKDDFEKHKQKRKMKEKKYFPNFSQLLIFIN